MEPEFHLEARMAKLKEGDFVIYRDETQHNRLARFIQWSGDQMPDGGFTHVSIRITEENGIRSSICVPASRIRLNANEPMPKAVDHAED